MMKKWQDRYFVLDFEKRTLSYYTDISKSAKKGEYKIAADSTVQNKKLLMKAISDNLFVVTAKLLPRADATGR